MCNICRSASSGSGRACLVAVLDAAEAASAWRLDADDIADLEVPRDFARELLPVQQVARRRSGLSAARPPRRARAPLADERKTARLEHPQLAHDAVAAAVPAGSARSQSHLVP